MPLLLFLLFLRAILGLAFRRAEQAALLLCNKHLPAVLAHVDRIIRIREHETEYHSAWEYFATGYLKYEEDPEAGHITNESFWHSYNTWTVGAAYKPCVSRGRNHHGNFRIGVSVGSDLDKVISAGHLGYEHTYNLYNGWGVFFQVKEDFVIRGKDTFRTGATIGVKIPL